MAANYQRAEGWNAHLRLRRLNTLRAVFDLRATTADRRTLVRGRLLYERQRTGTAATVSSHALAIVACAANELRSDGYERSKKTHALADHRTTKRQDRVRNQNLVSLSSV